MPSGWRGRGQRRLQGRDRPGEPETARRHRQGPDAHLLIVCTSDRGLAGGFNSNIVRAARRKAEALIAEGKQVYFYLVGRKGKAVIGRALPEADHPPARHQRDQAGHLRRRAGDRRRRHRPLPHRRHRRRPPLLRPLPLGAGPGAGRPADHPGAAGRGGRRRSRRRSPRSNMSPTRTRSWPRCCRATSPSRSSARCSRMPRRSRAAG